MKRSMFLSAVMVLVAVGPSAPAQPNRQGELVVKLPWCMHRSCWGVLEHRATNGVVTTLAPWVGPGTANNANVTMGPRNRNALVLVNYGASFVSVDLATKQAVTQPVQWPHYLASGLDLSQTGKPVTCVTDLAFNRHLVEIDPTTGTSTTIRATLPASGRLACRDLSTGDFLFVSSSPLDSGVYRVGATGQSVARITNRPAFDVAQNHIDGSFLICYATSLERMVGGVSTTLVGASFSHVAFDRAPGAGVIAAASAAAVLRCTATGTLVTIVPHPRIADHGFAQDRNVASESLVGRNHFRLNVSFPADANRGFVLGASASGFQPGVAVGGRRIPLVADPLFVAVVSGNLGPLLRNQSGLLDASGEAQATLDLRRFGATLAGVRLWFAALTLDPSAPAGVSTISKPILIVLD